MSDTTNPLDGLAAIGAQRQGIRESAENSFSAPQISAVTAELLFAIEAALPFVEAYVGSKMCSSAGGPASLRNILKKYDWDKQRWQWLGKFQPNETHKPVKL